MWLVIIIESGGNGWGDGKSESGMTWRVLPEQLGGEGATYPGGVNLACT